MHARFWLLVLQQTQLFVENVGVDAVAFQHFDELVILEPVTPATVPAHAEQPQHRHISALKGKVFPYSVGPVADPGVQAVSPQAEVNHVIDIAVGCHYFLSGLRLPT